MHSILQQFIDIVFPKHCISCEEEGSFLCNNCFKQIKKFKNPVMKHPPNPFKKVIIPCPYHKNPILSKAVHRMKYSYYKDISKDLARLLTDALKEVKLPRNTHLVPIPLHRKRENFRGFNQSELLAFNINFPVVNLLTRSKETQIQANLKRSDRLKNLQNAFTINPHIENLPKTTPLLLIDDICTTFTTVTQAAKVLQKNGYDVLLTGALALA